MRTTPRNSILIILLSAFSVFLPLACSLGGNTLEKNLTPEELSFARGVIRESYINIYNQVAQEDITEDRDILEYYFYNGLRICSSLGVMNTLTPDEGFTYALLNLFDKDVTDRFLDYDSDTGRCSIKKDGKYMELLKTMSRRNSFLKGFFEYMQGSDGCSGVPYIVSINYKNIDFSKEDEEFITFLALLTRPGKGPVVFGKPVE